MKPHHRSRLVYHHPWRACHTLRRSYPALCCFSVLFFCLQKRRFCYGHVWSFVMFWGPRLIVSPVAVFVCMYNHVIVSSCFFFLPAFSQSLKVIPRSWNLRGFCGRLWNSVWSSRGDTQTLMLFFPSWSGCTWRFAVTFLLQSSHHTLYLGRGRCKKRNDLSCVCVCVLFFSRRPWSVGYFVLLCSRACGLRGNYDSADCFRALRTGTFFFLH